MKKDLRYIAALGAVFAIIATSGCDGYTPIDANPTAAPQFDPRMPATFVMNGVGPAATSDVWGWPLKTSLTLVNYGIRSSTNAITLVDVLPPTTTTISPASPNYGVKVIADSVQYSYGRVIFQFAQLLDGNTIETPHERDDPLDPSQKLRGGQGNFAGQFKYYDFYAPKREIVNALPALPSDYCQDVSLTAPCDTMWVQYFPTGYWVPDANANTLDTYPRPAISIFPAAGNATATTGVFTQAKFAVGKPIVIHLYAGDVKGVSGLPLEPARNKGGDVIIDPDNNKPVAASVVFVVIP